MKQEGGSVPELTHHCGQGGFSPTVHPLRSCMGRPSELPTFRNPPALLGGMRSPEEGSPGPVPMLKGS